MPLFGKRDEAEKLFEEAERCFSIYQNEFDLDRAIRLLEEAVMLKPDKKEYCKLLDESRDIRAKTIESSTSQYSTPKDVYLFLLSKLEAGRTGAVSFRPKDTVGYVVVCFDYGEKRELPSEVSVSIKYPYDEEPNQLISRLGISFPSGYALSAWKRRECAFFDGPRCPPSDLAETIDQLFTKLLGASPNYIVRGWINWFDWRV